MDDIYGELENYNDVNALDELRNENNELKFKLGEYQSTMDKLQKDFDKLSAEYKKLEVNYSSLLKTARAEVERKTQIIKNLNMEKDMMVLNSLQKSNKNLRNIKRNLQDRAASKKSLDNKSNKSKELDSKKFEPDKERPDEKRLPSIDTRSGTTDTTNKSVDNKLGKPDAYQDKHNDSKENIAKKTWPQSIRNRRKSMPVLSKQEFSSDEEVEDEYSIERGKRKDWLRKERRVAERPYRGKYNHKISETSGIDEKYSSYQESSRETFYKGSAGRHDKHRIQKNKNEPMHIERHRKLTPERPYRRSRMDHTDDRNTSKTIENMNQNTEHRKYRVLESPPVERYDSYSRTRSRDRRTNYDRDHVEERPKSRLGSRGLKHKITDECQEPSSKRARTDTSSAFNEEDKRNRLEKECIMEPLFSKTLEQWQKNSCLSPDFSNSDTETAYTVKEVTESSCGPKEDPRLTSKNYITKPENDRVVLCTVGGRNINLRKINVAKWNYHAQMPAKPVIVHEALTPQYTDEDVQQLYADIDTPIDANTSVEDGEIQTDTNNDDRVTDDTRSNDRLYGADAQNNDSAHVAETYSNYNLAENPNINNDVVKEVHTKDKMTKEDTSTSSKYRIPKIKKPDKKLHTVKSATKTPLGKLFNEYNIVPEIDHIKQSSKLDVDQLYSPEKEDKVSSKSKSSTKHIEQVNQLRDKAKWREMVEGDLELSDETCDNTDILKKDAKERKVKSPEECPQKRQIREDTVHSAQVSNEKTASKVKSPVEKPTVKETETKKKQRKVKSPEDCLKKRQSRADKVDSTQVANEEIATNAEPVEKPTVFETETRKKQRKVKSPDDCPQKHQSIEDKVDSTQVPNEKTATKIESPVEKSTDTVKETDTSKKHKSKRRSQKHKDVQELISPEAKNDKKNKPKKDSKQKHNIKEKYTDLFGDSSSLITPEDLGEAAEQYPVPNQTIPFFEDAQDGVDVDVHKPVEPRPTSATVDVDIPIVKEKEIVCPDKAALKQNTPNEDSTTIPKKDISCPDITTEPPNLFVNFSSDTSNKDVINTVIISSGVQPHVTTDKSNLVQKMPIVQNIEKLDQNIKVPTALASSTPYKDIVQCQKEIDSRIPESDCNNSNNNIVRDDVSRTSTLDDSSHSNGMEAENNGDVPDVRIFVKRRRKVVRKTK